MARTSARPADITQFLLDTNPDIVHFSGHGTAGGHLCFEDESGKVTTVSPDALAAAFRLFSDRVRCVVLNACFSELQARAVSQHIPHVVGMRSPISDDAAIAFSVGFYKALGAGRSIEQAYEFGLVEMALHNIPENLIPLLFTAGGVQYHGAPCGAESPAARVRDRPLVITVGHRIPVQPLLGRDLEVSRATKLLRHSSLALVGMKGIGKSKLASAVFERILDDDSSQFSAYCEVGRYRGVSLACDRISRTCSPMSAGMHGL